MATAEVSMTFNIDTPGLMEALSREVLVAITEKAEEKIAAGMEAGEAYRTVIRKARETTEQKLREGEA